jgi:hypothetical protein
MPTRTTQSKRPSKRGRSVRPLVKPDWPGYVTDEFADYMVEYFRRLTPAEVNQGLIRAGIYDKDGNLTAPYRGED